MPENVERAFQITVNLGAYLGRALLAREEPAGLRRGIYYGIQNCGERP